MFHVCLYYTVMSVPESLVTTCWERADHLALLRVMFPVVLSHGRLPIGILGQVWYLIVSIPELCTLTYFTYGVLGQVWYLNVSIPYHCLLLYFYIN